MINVLEGLLGCRRRLPDATNDKQVFRLSSLLDCLCLEAVT